MECRGTISWARTVVAGGVMGLTEGDTGGGVGSASGSAGVVAGLTATPAVAREETLLE